MRKSILGAAILTILAGAGSLYWSAVIAPSVILSISEESQSSLSQGFFQKDSSALPQNDKLLQYTGQAMNYLGDPKIIAGYPKQFVDELQKRLNTAIEYIAKSPKEEVYWIELGMVKKQFDNYIGARDAWEYARLINNKNSIIYHNLGSLYALYLRDFEKAEKYYQTSVNLDRLSSQSYLALAEFYKDFYKEKSDLVDDVLLAGLGLLPHDANLVLNLAFYYKSTGDKEKAIKYLEQFLQLPETNEYQAFAIKKELEALGAR